MPKFISCRNKTEKDNFIAHLATGAYPDGLSKSQKRDFRNKLANFCMLNDDLFFLKDDRRLKCVFEFESDLAHQIIKTEHEIAHVGINKMVDKISHKYYGISKERIAAYVKSCQACLRYNSLQTIQPIYINDITKKYDRYMMDCVDLRKYSEENDGFSWILNVIDTFTKYLWSFKLKNKSANDVKDSLRFIFRNFGVPDSIQSDNGKEFRNTVLTEYFADLEIMAIHGRSRNPKAQGQVERVNQTIKRWLGKKLFASGGHRWINFHEDIVFEYNQTKHRATNKSPFLLFFG